MSGPLDGAQAKLQRAQHHLHTFQAQIQLTFERDPVGIAAEYDLDARDYVIQVKSIPELPPFLGAILGDVLHNLRSGLNQLAFELVRTCGNLTSANEPAVQFPIMDKSPKPPRTFGQQVSKSLPGIGPDPIAVIEREQPYNRPDLGRLGRLSNDDKHRAPVTMISRVMSVVPEFRAPPGYAVAVELTRVFEPLDLGAEIARLKVTGPPGNVQVKMKGHFIPEITFEDGSEVIHALMLLGSQCSRIAKGLEAFIEPPPSGRTFFLGAFDKRRSWPSFATTPPFWKPGHLDDPLG